jgi:hypothetical protein
MAISKVNPVVAASNTPDAMTCTVGTLYEKIQTFTPAIYTITCSSAVDAVVEFYSGVSTRIIAANTVSGTVTINLVTAADRIRIFVKSGTDIPVTITKSANSLVSGLSGTLDTITTTSTYTGTSTSGYGYAVVVGGGGSGFSGGGGSSYPSGGGSGGIGAKLVQLTGSMPIVIGTAGTSNTDGGATTFAGITAGGGSKGNNTFDVPLGGTVTGGTFNLTGGRGGTYNQNDAGLVTSPYPFCVTGSTGGGGGGQGYSGAGSGIGTGSTSGGPNATGYGAGGAGITGTGVRSDGRSGVVYILRF